MWYHGARNKVLESVNATKSGQWRPASLNSHFLSRVPNFVFLIQINMARLFVGEEGSCALWVEIFLPFLIYASSIFWLAILILWSLELWPWTYDYWDLLRPRPPRIAVYLIYIFWIGLHEGFRLSFSSCADWLPHFFFYILTFLLTSNNNVELLTKLNF